MAASDSSKGKGKIIKRADPSTIQDKFLVGYQGWYTCGGDGEPVGPGHHGWLHWFDAPIPDGGRPNTDLWPDVTDYSPSELFPAPGLKTTSGEQIFLFSSRHPKTVQRHFHWMAEHGVDGAFLQRFASQCDLEAGSEGIMRIRDEVGDLVRDAAEKEGRVFAIMYDVSGVPPDRIQRVIERDLVHLIRNKGVLDSPNYLREKGKAVIALWGFGFENAGHTPALVRAITTYIRNATPGGAYIVAGAPAHWRTAESDADRNPEFLDVWLNDFDAISPWTVGRYRNEQDADHFADTKIKGDMELIKRRNEDGQSRKIDYIPVVLPGGSGYNLSQGKWGFNDIKRNGGRFLWQQIFNAKRQGVRIMYGAMWDEYDEGTAFMPAIEKKRMLPLSDRHHFLALDADGYDLPSDWYMRICGFAAEGLRGERRIHETFPSKELQDYWASRPKYEEIDHKSGDFVSGGSKGDESGGGDGQSYQQWLSLQKEDKEEPPPPPYSLEEDEIPASQPAPVVPTSYALPTASSSSQPASGKTPASPYVSPPTPVAIDARPIPLPNAAATLPEPSKDTPYPGPGPIRQATVPPPVNESSRPQPVHHASMYASGSATRHDSMGSSNTGPYSSHRYNESASEYYNNPHSQHSPVGDVQDPVSSLADDFNRHGIGSSGARPRQNSMSPPPIHPAHPAAQISRPQSSHSPHGSTSMSPPPLHPAHPTAQASRRQSSDSRHGSTSMSPPPLHPAHPAAQGGRPLSSNSRPHSRPHSQAGYSQAGHSQASSPTSGTYPATQTAAQQQGGSWSQGQWPPSEWGLGGPRSETAPPSSYAGQNQGGVDPSRPQTFTSSYTPIPGVRPHTVAPGGGLPPSHLGNPQAHPQYQPSSPYPPGDTPPFQRPGVLDYTHGGSSYGSGAPSFPSGPGGSSPYPLSGPEPSLYPGQIASTPYGSSNYTPTTQGPGYGGAAHNPPHHSTPAPFAGSSYYPGETPPHGFPAAHGSSYPGQPSYGSGPPPVNSQPYGVPHGLGYPPSEAPQGGGFTVPQVPGGDPYYNTSQSQSSSGYAPSYIAQPASSNLYGSTLPHQGSWYPGSSGSPAPPMHPHPPTQSPYSSSSGPFY